MYPKIGPVVKIQFHARSHGQGHALCDGNAVVHHNRTASLQQSIRRDDLSAPHIGILSHCRKHHPLLHAALQREDQFVVHRHGRVLSVFRQGDLGKHSDAVSPEHLEIIRPRPALGFQVRSVHIDPERRAASPFQPHGRDAQTIPVAVIDYQLPRARTHRGNHRVELHRVGGKGKQRIAAVRERPAVIA